MDIKNMMSLSKSKSMRSGIRKAVRYARAYDHNGTRLITRSERKQLIQLTR